MHFVISSLRARLAAASLIAASAIALGAAPASASVADLQVAQPGTLPYGQSYSQYGADWWKYELSKSVATDPVTDTTGANCAKGQSGLVWFLASSTPGAGPITRNCTVPFGRALLIPVVNYFYGAFADDPADQRTTTYVRSQVTPAAKAATGLSASIDGSPVTGVSRFLEQSTIFSATLPADNIFASSDLAGTVLSPSADAGYYLLVYPLLPGKHTITVASGSPAINVTYKITTPLF
jgi:hypothetical protein